jgi:hypothetical protein
VQKNKALRKLKPKAAPKPKIAKPVVEETSSELDDSLNNLLGFGNSEK